MIALVLGFQVHQPFRLRADYDYFKIGREHTYLDLPATRQQLRQLVDACYRPLTALLRDLVRRYEGRFRFALAFSGPALEQLRDLAPEILADFAELVATGQVEVLAQTGSHSLACLHHREEFGVQVQAHRALLWRHFGVEPAVFVNTELIYHDDLACEVEQAGFRALLTEGAESWLRGRAPAFVYQASPTYQLKLLLRHAALSDGLLQCFAGDPAQHLPPTPDQYAAALARVAGNGEVVNLFFNLASFGAHLPATSGILDFLRALPGAVLARPELVFLTPSQAAAQHQPIAKLAAGGAVSWAAGDSGVATWMGNPMQDSALQYLYSLREPVLNAGDEGLVRVWRHLQGADYFAYLCTRWSGEGDARRAASPFASPHDAYVVYCNILNDIQARLRRRGVSSKAP